MIHMINILRFQVDLFYLWYFHNYFLFCVLSTFIQLRSSYLNKYAVAQSKKTLLRNTFIIYGHSYTSVHNKQHTFFNI